MQKEKIYYTKSKTITEEFEVELDLDNCYLHSYYDHKNSAHQKYFAHFKNEHNNDYTIIEFQRMDYGGFKLEKKERPFTHADTPSIKEFFNWQNKDVEIITKEEFMNKYNEIKEKL